MALRFLAQSILSLCRGFWNRALYPLFSAFFGPLFYPRYLHLRKDLYLFSHFLTTFPYHLPATLSRTMLSTSPFLQHVYCLKSALNRALGFGKSLSFFRGGAVRSMRDGWERESDGLMRTQDYGWDSGKRFQHGFFLASHTNIQIFIILEPG